MTFSKRFFYLLLFLLPTQLGAFFWPQWALVYGIRVDYLAPKIFLTDIIVIALIISWLFEDFNEIYKFAKANCKLILGLIVFGIINIVNAQVWQISLFGLLKIIEFVLLAMFVARNFNNLNNYKKYLSGGVIAALLIALGQLANQAAVGGLLYWVGERSFSASTPGIALASIFGREVLRPYSTFPHPNAMAGYALVSFFLIDSKFVKALCVMLIIISFSQGAWIVFVALMLIKLAGKRALELGKLVVLPAVLFSLASVWLGFLLDETRGMLATIAGDLFVTKPLLGIGLSNYITQLPNYSIAYPEVSWWLQPVHNIFLLVLAEAGVIGLIVFYTLLAKTIRKQIADKNLALFFALVAIILTGLVDHYWLTLQQTQLFFSLVIGASLSKIT